ncbi:MAG: hypothetical protein ACI9JN_001214 [Bacteroidia bacterium]|jgi:uncharacterized protein YbjT (DUF2867 family)
MDTHKTKRAIITGASGMIGRLVLQHCLANDAITEVVSLVRKRSSQNDPKLTEVVIPDFNSLDAGATYWQNIDVVFYCIGVYTGSVNRALFRQITVDYPVHFGKNIAKYSPNAKVVLLSGQGADRSEKSKVMFAKDKGAAENALSNMGFQSFNALRPGYIYPVEKRSEPNVSYRLMRRLYPLLKGLGSKFSISSVGLARVMFDIGLHGSKREIYENQDLIHHLKTLSHEVNS